MTLIEIMMKICPQCVHQKECHKPCPYIWEKIIESERKEK